MTRRLVKSRIAWPRGRFWRPGEPITLDDEDGTTTTYLLRGVMRDHDPRSAYATVLLEPIRSMPSVVADPDDDFASAVS